MLIAAVFCSSFVELKYFNPFKCGVFFNENGTFAKIKQPFLDKNPQNSRNRCLFNMM